MPSTQPNFTLDSPAESRSRDVSPPRNLESQGFFPVSKAPTSSSHWPRASFNLGGSNTSGIGGVGANLHQSPSSARLPRHFFPDRAESLRDLSALANLVDDRGNWYEDARLTPEEIKELCAKAARKNRSALREYYEHQNEILDGWREVDLVVESQFPAEVLKRFGNVEDLEEVLGRQQHRSDDSGDETSDVDAAAAHQERGRRGSVQRTASALFSGFWFGQSNNGNKETPTGKKKQRALDLEEGADVLSASPRGRLLGAAGGSNSSSTESPRRTTYGATNNPTNLSNSFVVTSPQPLTAINDADEDGTSVRSAVSTSRSPERVAGTTTTTSNGEPKAGIPRALTPRGTRIAALENVPAAAVAKKRNGGAGKKIIVDEEEEDSDDEGDEHSVEGSLDRRLARQREVRHAARIVKIPDGPSVRVERSQSTDRHRSNNSRGTSLARTPGGITDRERKKLLDHVPGKADRDEEEDRKENFAINVNLAANVLLLGGKGFAVVSSNSVSLIASFVDSALDLLSTLIIFATTRAINYRSFHTYIKYPTGKRRFGPLGVVIFSVLMIASFAQVLVESIQRLLLVYRTGADPESATSLPLVGIAFMLLTIAIKTVSWLVWRSSKSSGVRAVAQDAENDVVFNIASLVFPVVGGWLGWPALDPIGGIALSIYIIYEWVDTLLETVARLSGAVAETEDIARVLYLVTRFRSVKAVSAFELYHSGDDMIVECDIVLPASIALKEAHDLGEIVTYCAESLDQVERAYIHLDYAKQGPPGHLAQRG